MLGLVFSYNNTPSLGKVYFQLEKDTEVSKGQFVSIEHPLGKIMAMVVDISRYNPYFEQTQAGIEVNEILPTDEWHTTIVETKPLGLLHNHKFVRLSFPPYPGAKVNTPESEDLKKFLGFKENGLFIGEIENTNTPVKVDLSKLFQKHLAILAMSGAGKSYTVSVLLEALLNLQKDESIGVVLFDVHGEYRNFAEPVSDSKYKDFSKRVVHYDASKLKFALHSLDMSLFANILDVSGPQYRVLIKALGKLKENSDSNVFGFDELKEIIKEIDTRTNIDDRIYLMERMNMFGKTSNFKIDSIVKPGQLTIIDLSDVLDMTHKQLILAYFANYLFRLRQSERIAPFLLLLEEAHQFVPEGKAEEYAKARSIIETIAREGRKFGASLCLISQRPIKLSSTVLSQCSTHMLMRITNPYDLKHIQESSEALDTKSVELISGLNVGETLMVGSSVNHPLFFKVRERTSQPNKYEKNLQEMVKEFTDKEKRKDNELDSYL